MLALLLDEATIESRSDFHIMFDGTKGMVQGHQVMSHGLTFTEEKNVTRLKRGKMYRFNCNGNLFKEEEGGKVIGRVKKEDVLMFIEQSREVPYVYKVISGDQAGWLCAYLDCFEELTDAEEVGKREAVPNQADSGSLENALQK